MRLGYEPAVEEDTYTPLQAARILRLFRQCVTQMLNIPWLEQAAEGAGGATVPPAPGGGLEGEERRSWWRRFFGFD
jgi:hypothetical protein